MCNSIQLIDCDYVTFIWVFILCIEYLDVYSLGNVNNKSIKYKKLNNSKMAEFFDSKYPSIWLLKWTVQKHLETPNN